MSDGSNRTAPIRALDRFRVAAGLRDLAAFIERNPTLPLPNFVEISLSVVADSDQEERDEIDRIAEILSVSPRFLYGPHHYAVSRDFGPVVFRAMCISQEYMRKYSAKMALIDVIDERGEITTEEWPV